MIVEDDAGLRNQLDWSFGGYEVVVAEDRAAALAAFRGRAPAVVTLDLGLPPDPDGTSEGDQRLHTGRAHRDPGLAMAGNVRELENRVKRAVIMADGLFITAADLDFDDPPEPAPDPALRAVCERADRAAIAQAMAAHDANISAAARDLEISRPLLYNLLNSDDMVRS